MELFRRSLPAPDPEPAPPTPRAYIDSIALSRVVVHTRGGSSLEGVLTRVYPDCIVLEHAAYLSAGGRTVIDGEAIIEHVKVDWLQRLGPGSTEEV